MDIKDIISTGLLELYVTGLANNEDVNTVEQWSAQYPEVRKEIGELERIMEAYALSVAIEPDSSLKQKILAKLDDNKLTQKTNLYSTNRGGNEINILAFGKDNDAKVYSMPSYFKLAAAACIVLLLGSLVANYILYNKYNSDKSQSLVYTQRYDSVVNLRKTDSAVMLALQQKISERNNNPLKNPNTFPQSNNITNANEGISEYANVAGDKYSVPVVLKGTKKSPDALAKIFWMKNTGAVYVDATFLPHAPQGKQYQLWAIVNGAPVDAGMIKTDNSTYKIQKMKSFGSAEAFAITLENTGGSATPTMEDMVVKSKT